MRGDPPPEGKILIDGERSTPHARGSTAPNLLKILGYDVYPACAGIHLATIAGLRRF